MLSSQQQHHFRAFGFLFLENAFASEIDSITAVVERDWAADPQQLANDERRTTAIVERNPELNGLPVEDRLYPAIEQLLGADPLWAGSEGNLSSKTAVKWHPDRKYYLDGERHWMDFDQLKVMMYLDPVARDSGCLRVIPGSHRDPLHHDLAEQELHPETLPFGLEPSDIPCVALESQPGDVILFDHRSWHGAFGGGPRRRYLAMKFTQQPTAPHRIESLRKYSTGVFSPDEAFVNHEDPRIRAMVRIPEVQA